MTHAFGKHEENLSTQTWLVNCNQASMLSTTLKPFRVLKLGAKKNFSPHVVHNRFKTRVLRARFQLGIREATVSFDEPGLLIETHRRRIIGVYGD